MVRYEISDFDYGVGVVSDVNRVADIHTEADVNGEKKGDNDPGNWAITTKTGWRHRCCLRRGRIMVRYQYGEEGAGGILLRDC